MSAGVRTHPAPGAGSPDNPRGTLALLLTGSVLAQVATGGGRVAVPLFALHLGASTFMVGSVMACYAVLSSFLAIRSGRLVDRIGPRWPLIVGLAGQAAGLAIPAFWHSIWALALAAAVMGPCGGLFLLAVNSTTGRISGETNRASNFSTVSISQSVSQFAGPPIAGALIDFAGHPTAFAVLAAIGAGTVALLLAFRSRFPAGGTQAAVAAARVGDLLRHPALRPIFIVCTLLPIGWELFFFFVPLHGHALDLSATSIGFVYSSLSVTVIASRAAVPWLVQRVSDWTLLAIALGTEGLVFMLFPLTWNAASMMAMAIVLGTGMGLSHPVMLALLYRTAPPGRQGEAMGIRSTTIFAAQIVGPLTLGAISTGAGLAAALWPFSLLLLAGCRYAYARRSHVAS